MKESCGSSNFAVRGDMTELDKSLGKHFLSTSPPKPVSRWLSFIIRDEARNIYTPFHSLKHIPFHILKAWHCPKIFLPLKKSELFEKIINIINYFLQNKLIVYLLFQQNIRLHSVLFKWWYIYIYMVLFDIMKNIKLTQVDLKS